MQNTSTEILYDKFEIIETIKKDVYSTVYLANHIYLGKKIILKTLNTDELSDKTILARFKREAKILAMLEHPNLIKVLDFGMDKSHFYISFEYFDSKNLRSIIRQNNYTLEQKRSLVIRLMKALNAAHQNHIVHRDIKPENLLVNPRLELKIADFGLALMQDETKLTIQSSIVGTPSYMSPEQIRGETVHPQSDLFSAGIVALELFIDENPFLGKDINETINKILTFREEDIEEKVAHLPEDIQTILMGLLRKNTEKRFHSAEEVLSILGIQASNHDLKLEIEDTAEDKTGKYFLIGTSLLVAMIIIAAGIYYFLAPKQGEVINPNLAEKNYTFTDKNSRNIFSPSITRDNVQNSVPGSLLQGKLFVEAKPYADVYIDNKKVDTTPLDNYIQLDPGKHTLKLVHPDYPPYVRRINTSNDNIEAVKINFQELTGSLDCKVQPWGEVFIDGKHVGTTPLREPINLYPGRYNVQITNKQYADTLRKRIRIVAKDTTEVTFSFEKAPAD